MRNQNETEHPTTGDPAVGSRDLLCCVALECAEAVQYESGPTLNAEHIKPVLEKYLPRWVEKYYVPKRSGWHYTRNLDGTISARYFDDSRQSWWVSNAIFGWTPNDSFTEWLQVPGVSENQAA
jgi:hypothetical protein